MATFANFPVVFAGLLAITLGTDGNDEIALLNLWALWGIAQGLLGQIAQVSGVLDGREWTELRALRLIPVAAVPVTVLAILLSDTWFPDHETWWIATLALVVAVVVIGRQRAVLARRLDGAHALLVAALENSIRSTAMILVVVAATEREGVLGWGALAIVGPFVVSIALLANRIDTTDASAPDADGTDMLTPGRSIASGVLSGLPALAAYAIIPGLTLLDMTDDLGSIAVAASLLRGPLLVATFVAPVLLERWLVLDTNRPPQWVLALPAGLLALQLVASAITSDGSSGQLVAQTIIAGLIAGLTYLLILRMLGAISDSPGLVVAGLAATTVFVITLVMSTELSWLHPFVALGAACAVIVLVVGRISATMPAVST